MKQVPTSDPDEAAGRGIARDTKRKYNELELSMARPGTVRDRFRDSCWIYGVIAVAVLAVLAAFCVYIQPWNRLKGDMRASPYMAFQDKELQCHEGCRQHDLANSNCLQECLPEKLNCMSSECDGMSSDSMEYSSCALDCHSSVCENKCSDVGRRASLCHLSCAPDMRTLVEDPPCVRKCNALHDNSCMGGCAESTKKCLNMKCVGNTHEEYSVCQEECELNSCGRDCQASNKAFAECTAHCYPANPAGQEAVFVPPSVQAADKAFLRTSHCKNLCRLSDHRHTLCMHDCGPKITKCMQTQCPNAVPESYLQKKCMASCERSSCGDACLQTFNQAKHCYQDSCNPDHASACNKRCHAEHDDSCMKKCGTDLGSCISSRCSALLDQDADAYMECQQTCMTTHCGADCAQRSLALVSCNEFCKFDS